VSPAKAESAPAAQQRSQALAELKAEFFRLAAERDRNRAGLTMEWLLNRLFATFELSPATAVQGRWRAGWLASRLTALSFSTPTFI
jgi:hypothetical protein